MSGTADDDRRAVELAARPDADPAALAVLAADAALLARAPVVAAALYRNPRVPISVANLAVATCARAGVAPEEIPGFEELARAVAADPAATDATAADAAFAAVLAASAADGDGDADAAADADVAADAATGGSPVAPRVAGDRPGAGGPAPARRSAKIDFGKLKLHEKIRLATLGNAFCRQQLMRDANRMVALAAIRSPQITDAEIIRAAGNRALSEDVIRYIAGRKELVKLYPVKLALVGNPKCPLAVALRLLPLLHADDLKAMARSKSVPGALSTAAKKLAAARTPQ